MRKLLRVLPLLFLSLFFLVKPVSAHVLKTDGNIGAILHINPDDDPIVGQEANLYFEVKDEKGKFNANNCLCSVTVNQADQTLYQSNTTAASASGLVFNYTFPQKAVYRLTLTGSASDSSFSSFKLVYDLRVSRETSDQSTNSNFFTKYLHFIIIGLIGLVFLGFLFFSRSKKPVQKGDSNEK